MTSTDWCGLINLNKMKILTTILTLLILISCEQNTPKQNQIDNKTISTVKQKNNMQVPLSEMQKENTICDCDGLVDWQKDVKVKLFDKPYGKVIDTLTHDIQNEDFLTFTILDSEDEFFKVKIGREIGKKKQIGWIKKEKYLGTYANNYSDNDTLFLYSKPSLNSKPTDTINKYYIQLYTITDCHGKWAKVIMKTTDKEFKGWIEPEKQCPSPYTTCN